MTANNLVNKFEYKPLYKPNQLICGTGQTAIVSGWTVKSAIVRQKNTALRIYRYRITLLLIWF